MQAEDTQKPDIWKVSERVLRMLLFAGVFLCLLQIWLPSYFVNGDGPCHIANARVMHNLWTGTSVDFYKRFYHFNLHPHPNWLSHLILAGLMFVVNGLIAEKLLLTGYVLLMVTGIYRLIRNVAGRPTYWPLVLFLFIFHNLVAQGFYNFSYSIGFFCLLVAEWIKYLHEKDRKRLGSFFLLLLLTYFSHPVAFLLGGVTCGALTISHAVAEKGSAAGRKVLHILVVLGLCNIPLLLLFAGFANRQHSGHGPHLQFVPERFWELVRFEYLVNYDHREVLVAAISGIVFCWVFMVALLRRAQAGKVVHRFDGFLLTFLFTMSLFPVVSNLMLGGGALVARLGLFAILFMVLCVAYMPVRDKVLNIAGLLLFSYSSMLAVVRMNINLEGSGAIADHLTVGKYIKPGSVVLPLHFATFGKKDRGEMITDKNNTFAHEGQYLAIAKPVIVLDNYEANTNYFPLKWHDGINPHKHLSRKRGIEGVPPSAAINEYRLKNGVVIDYVVTLCFDSSMLKDPDVSELMNEVAGGYHIIYTSPARQAVLWRRN
jgi:hypothetical protein